MVAFIRQYQYNSDMAPNRMQLQNMCKKEHESFKEYAQRWRDLAAQVVPPMMEREMITMIGDTLLVFYYEKMVGYMPLSFADLVLAGERIEVGLKRGKFDYAASMNSGDRRTRANGENKKPMLWLSFLQGQISHQLNNINTQPTSTILITHHSISQEHSIIHKARLLHIRYQTLPLTRTKTPSREEIFQKRSL